MGPSVYDTAQVLRLYPEKSSIDRTLEWLTIQQQADGGWGDPSVPLARTATTLAALLALATHAGTSHPAISAGVRFLREQAAVWEGTLPEDLPAGVELLVPYLTDEATALGLDVPPVSAPLRALGERRQALLARIQIRAGTTIVHSWEAWGKEPQAELLDETGSVGHSPAATAAWLRAAQGHASLCEARARAQRYLERAALATGDGAVGVMPTAWPIDRFEQSFSLYVLLIAGLLDHPALADVVAQQVQSLERAMRPNGIGYSDYFAPDGDDTAAACAVLASRGQPGYLSALDHFAVGDYFCAWQGELQAATSVTSHAIHALRLAGGEFERAAEALLKQQCENGRWVGDKWNRSWVYTTSQALIALSGHAPEARIQSAIDALLKGQHDCGAWGDPAPSGEETAYATLALRSLQRDGTLPAYANEALQRGERWLADPQRAFDGEDVAYWLAKEPYRPRRLARLWELAALAAAHLG
ncbi:MAG: hypothetical protein DIU80_012065 [Chloroflexota bacterium]